MHICVPVLSIDDAKWFKPMCGTCLRWLHANGGQLVWKHGLAESISYRTSASDLCASNAQIALRRYHISASDALRKRQIKQYMKRWFAAGKEQLAKQRAPEM